MAEARIQAVLFDKDGTLHDTEKVFYEAWKRAAEEFGGIPDMETTIRDCTGINLVTTKAYWNRKYPDVDFDRYIACRNRHFENLVAHGIPVKEGAVELLTYLTAHGYRVGLATSTGAQMAMEHMRRADMLRFFDRDAIITGNMVAHGKPAPDIYLLAAERLGVLPAACIGVEDSPNGIRAIHAAGMRAVLVPDRVPPTPDVEAMAWKRCDRLTDLIPILENQ